jgi:hypothetical protein
MPAFILQLANFGDCLSEALNRTLMSWSKGKCLLWDATCSDTLANSYISSTSRSTGAAALSAEKRKHKKYKGVANLYKFVPFALETLGPFGEEALDLNKDLGRRLIETSGELRSRAYRGINERMFCSCNDLYKKMLHMSNNEIFRCSCRNRT